jgi:DNA-binding LacI/PurR family transcriptional regulator
METEFNLNGPSLVEQKPNRRDSAREAVKAYIRGHSLRPGELLPPVRALSEHFGLSRDAIWRALLQLQEEGWIKARANKRYEVSEEVYSRILRSLTVKAIFTGRNSINFTGFRRLADALKGECQRSNMDLRISLLPLNETPADAIWSDCDVMLIDSESSRGFLRVFPDFKVPVIGLDAEYSDRYLMNVVTDHHMGGRMVAERMIRQGSTSVTVVHFEEPQNRIQARIDGFQQVWLESGRPTSSLRMRSVKWSPNHFETALHVQKELRGFKGESDFFITDGRLAAQFLDILDYLKFSIPRDLRLIGYDGAQSGEVTNPPMTVIQQDMEKIASVAVARMSTLIRGEQGVGELVRVDPRLVARISG